LAALSDSLPNAMVIAWDERKRVTNVDKHEFDFAALSQDFFDNAVIVPTKLGRFLAVGTFTGFLVPVVFASLGSEAISVISMRPASPKERSYVR
jgi:uncharacterized protein